MTKFPVDSPDAIYERGLSGQSDLYLVKSGPGETKGWGTTTLFFVEVVEGEPIDEEALEGKMKEYEGADPQPPHLLSFTELHERLAGYLVLRGEAEEQHTSEFEALAGMSGSSGERA